MCSIALHIESGEKHVVPALETVIVTDFVCSVVGHNWGTCLKQDVVESFLQHTERIINVCCELENCACHCSLSVCEQLVSHLPPKPVPGANIWTMNFDP